MKLAFLISAYTDPIHLKRFIDSLPEDAHFFIHIDKSIGDAPFRKLFTQPHVHFIENRVRVMWGSFTQVQFQMEMIRAALNSDTRYDYLFMLSGQDYPVWSNERIIKFLKEHQGKNFIKAVCLVNRPKSETFEYTRYRFLNNKPWKYGTLKSKFRVTLRHIAALFLKKPLELYAGGSFFKLYKGSDYFAITNELASYILATYDSNKELRQYFKNSFAPSETFAHTITFNSRFADSCLLFSDKAKEGIRLEDLTPLTYIEYENIIKELTEADYHAILASGKMLCRKCVTGISDNLMNMIDAYRIRTLTELVTDRQ